MRGCGPLMPDTQAKPSQDSRPRQRPDLQRPTCDGVYAGVVNATISLGRIAGIRIGVNWSWLVVFGLITWTLADSIFPDQNPGLSDNTYVAMALCAAVLFFASLLLHELGHALEARREGMQIEGITLWLFGGVAKFRGMFRTAGEEFRIAVAGPLVSLVIGLAFTFIPTTISLPNAVDGVATWLGIINLTLLVFNLLPALPLDGGRILRSALWQLKGDYGWATRVSTEIARACGLLIVAGGIFLLVFRGTFSGLWLAFVGWFVLQAAGGERRTLAIQEALAGVLVRDVMSREPVTVAANLTLGRFMTEIAMRERRSAYAVLDGAEMAGILVLRDAAHVPHTSWDETTVRDCMIPRGQLALLTPDESVVEALRELDESGNGHGLVLEGDRPVGVVSMSDIERALGASSRQAV
jgi:Zn-dependent protease/CBS domain-containing protein